jgi:hypothetical protein
MPIAAQQDTEIVKPGNHALQLHPVHQKDRERDFCFADVIEEGVLQILTSFGCHGRAFHFFARCFDCRETFFAQFPLDRSPKLLIAE